MKYIVSQSFSVKAQRPWSLLMTPGQAQLAHNRAQRAGSTHEFVAGESYKLHNIQVVRTPEKKYVYTFLNQTNKSVITKEFTSIAQADAFIDEVFQ